MSPSIGVNDAAHDVSGKPVATPMEHARGYRTLLEWTCRELPTVRFVLCEPFALVVGNVTPAWRENLIHRRETVRQVAREFDATFVPLQEPFEAACRLAPPEFWIYDGVHPTASGFGLIAREWLAAVTFL